MAVPENFVYFLVACGIAALFYMFVRVVVMVYFDYVRTFDLSKIQSPRSEFRNACKQYWVGLIAVLSFGNCLAAPCSYLL
jgi:uncharacterized membrane protein